MILGIDPKVDYAFKRFLGLERTRPILIDVLDKVRRPPPGHRIRSVELLDPFNPKETPDDKLSILDIKARDESGRQYNIEMQMFADAWYPERVTYYTAKLHQQQLREGNNYFALKPTISISFVNNERFPDVADYHLRFGLLEKKYHFELTNQIEFHFLELPKFTKTESELDVNSLDIWLYFLRHGEKIDTDSVPKALQQPLVLMAIEELKMLAQSEIERERYEARRKAQLDYNTGMKAAEMRGEKIGIIHLCERLLNRPETPTEQLASRSLEKLTQMADDLQNQVQSER